MRVGVLVHMAVPDMVPSALADCNPVESALVGIVGTALQAAAAEWTVYLWL